MPARARLVPALLSLSLSAAALGAESAAGPETPPPQDILEQTGAAGDPSPADPNTPGTLEASAEPPPAAKETATAQATGDATDEATDKATDEAIDDAVATTGDSSPDTTEDAVEATPEPPPEPAMSMAEIIALLQAQQQQIDAQKTLLESQAQQIAGLERELDTLRAPPPAETLQEEQVVKTETDAAPVDTPATEAEDPAAAEVAAIQAEETRGIEAGEAVSRAQTDDPTQALLEDFVGAWRLPGTSAALAVGGYVKANVVYNWDPLEIKDRFIVGSIPVGKSDGVEEQSSLTANQSRLNFDLREPTEFGLLRAFIEGDFAEDGDTFRLRHAFGQWKAMTAGKTWSAFVDTKASPEEVDFEGLNGRVNVRQSQIRFAPKLGEEYEFRLSLEDPNPQVANGSGVTRAPDIVMAGSFHPYPKLHTRVALLLRQIRAQPDSSIGNGVEKTYAWGLSLSGRYQVPYWDERDSLLFQLNGGDGIGRYVNDLSSVGNFDGIFNPNNGDLELFDIYSGYISFQHWWGQNQLRSNFTFGFVNVDNPGFLDGSAYQSTLRASGNLFWSPTPRIDVGGEYLWGERENENGKNADATQLQLAVRYRF